jgi:polysaccharide biosynthesis/export protein
MAALVLLCAGCANTKTALSFTPEMTAPTPVALAPGDSIKVAFPGLPELDQVQKVRVDGTVSLPMIGEVVANGKTLQAFQNELVARYKPQLQNSAVVVTLESGGIAVFVSGAVKNPGKIVLGRPTTVLQGIMEAGGPNEYADLRKVHLVRVDNGNQRTQLFDLKPTMRGEATAAFYLRDGDMIHIPSSFF